MPESMLGQQWTRRRRGARLWLRSVPRHRYEVKVAVRTVICTSRADGEQNTGDDGCATAEVRKVIAPQIDDRRHCWWT